MEIVPDTVDAGVAPHLDIFVKRYHPRSGSIITLSIPMSIFSCDYPVHGFLVGGAELDEGGAICSWHI